MRKLSEVRADRTLRREERGQVPALALGQVIETHVRRDSIQPRAQRRATIKAVDGTPRANQRLLHRVFGVHDGAHHPVAMPSQGTAMRFELGCARHHASEGRYHDAGTGRGSRRPNIPMARWLRLEQNYPFASIEKVC